MLNAVNLEHYLMNRRCIDWIFKWWNYSCFLCFTTSSFFSSSALVFQSETRFFYHFLPFFFLLTDCFSLFFLSTVGPSDKVIYFVFIFPHLRFMFLNLSFEINAPKSEWNSRKKPHIHDSLNVHSGRRLNGSLVASCVFFLFTPVEDKFSFHFFSSMILCSFWGIHNLQLMKNKANPAEIFIWFIRLKCYLFNLRSSGFWILCGWFIFILARNV